MGANQIEISYTVPNNTTFETVKTFTFDGPMVASGFCIKWASISCCPGARQVYVVTSGDDRIVSIGQFVGLHYQSGVSSACVLSGFTCVQRVVSEVRLEGRHIGGSYDCSGALVQMKFCITFTDQTTATDCVCTANCGATASYVDLTG